MKPCIASYKGIHQVIVAVEVGEDVLYYECRGCHMRFDKHLQEFSGDEEPKVSYGTSSTPQGAD